MHCYLLIDEDDAVQVMSDHKLTPDEMDSIRKEQGLPYGKFILLDTGAMSLDGDITAWICSPAGEESDDELRKVFT